MHRHCVNRSTCHAQDQIRYDGGSAAIGFLRMNRIVPWHRLPLWGLVLLLSACASQQFAVQPAAAGPVHQVERTQVFFVGGLHQDKRVDAAELCGGAGRVLRVDMRQKDLDLLMSTLTMGLYTPRRMIITCQGVGHAQD